ncbi:unnamed protein product [Echinostoma caproni]|uniref:USP domain-containing protein n=1 Tax=Echinostoma caproni TaxID=27848 RepID=A0A183APT5_9TREM|nr:unnamed protein product [Echinostoma caproni]
MNSLLQSLYMIPEFRDEIFKRNFEEYNYHSEDWKKPQTGIELQKLFVKLSVSSGRTVAAYELFDTLGPKSSVLGIPRDVFLERTFLFAQLQNPKPWPELDDLFTGKVKNRTRFETCNHMVEREEPFDIIHLPLRPTEEGPAMDTLEDCLLSLASPTLMKGEEALNCTECGTRRSARFQSIYSKLPHLLSLQLMRHRLDPGTGIAKKMHDRVTFPLTKLNLDTVFQNLDGYEKPLPKYELLSVVSHTGSLQFGHVIVYAR